MAVDLHLCKIDWRRAVDDQLREADEQLLVVSGWFVPGDWSETADAPLATADCRIDAKRRELKDWCLSVSD